MPVGSQPHSSWANVYDLAYEHSFGNFYSQLTDATIKVVVDRTKISSRIIDFGAGTGRLSIPLAEKGFDIVAVEPCKEMLIQLEQKQGDSAIRTICSKMENFVSEEKFDIALCVFTVILYLLGEESLKKALSAAYDSLNPGGILLIDIPSKAIFHGHSHNNYLLERSVTVTIQDGDIFNYHESIKIKNRNGSEFKYDDEFQIRYWPKEMVLTVLNKIGFSLEEDLSNCFSGAGSNYYIMKKAEQGAAPVAISLRSIATGELGR